MERERQQNDRTLVNGWMYRGMTAFRMAMRSAPETFRSWSQHANMGRRVIVERHRICLTKEMTRG